MKLSIVIPCYNERNTILKILDEIEQVHIPGCKKEVIIVDDGSTDGSQEILHTLKKKYKVFFNFENQGKSNAVKKGIAASRGDFVVIQDADLEYDPQDFIKMIEPLRRGDADFVNGSRFTGDKSQKVSHFTYRLANRIFTSLSNYYTDLFLTDVLSCYKMFRGDILRNKILPKLKAEGFSLEVELVAYAAWFRLRIIEMGISYHGRTLAEGKKIRIKDGLSILAMLLSTTVRR